MKKERAKSIGSRIQAFRKELGISQEVFAESLELSQNQISRIETGESMVTTNFVLKLYDMYGIDPSYLLVGKSARGLDYKMEKFVSWYEGLDDGIARYSAACICENIFTFAHQHVNEESKGNNIAL